MRTERERMISQDKKHTIFNDFHFPLKLYNKFEENHCFALFFTLQAMIQVTFMFSKVGGWDMIKKDTLTIHSKDAVVTKD